MNHDRDKQHFSGMFYFVLVFLLYRVGENRTNAFED